MLRGGEAARSGCCEAARPAAAVPRSGDAGRMPRGSEAACTRTPRSGDAGRIPRAARPPAPECPKAATPGGCPGAARPPAPERLEAATPGGYPGAARPPAPECPKAAPSPAPDASKQRSQPRAGPVCRSAPADAVFGLRPTWKPPQGSAPSAWVARSCWSTPPDVGAERSLRMGGAGQDHRVAGRPIPCHTGPLARLAQPVEHLICNQGVGGSSPPAGLGWAIRGSTHLPSTRQRPR